MPACPAGRGPLRSDPGRDPVFGDFMSFKHRAAGLLLLAALSGCALGIQQGHSPSDTFDVPIDYRQAYRRADAQVRECLLGAGGYRAVGDEQPAAGTARVEVRAPFSENVLA